MQTQRPVALVTGGNRGLGFGTSRKLAQRGFDIVMACRGKPDGEAAAARIRAEVPAARVDVLELDLTRLPSVRACAEAFRASGRPLNVLVCNAGLMVAGQRAQTSADGVELTLATNHVGHFLLTRLLLPELQTSAPSRVVVVTSRMHMGGGGMGAPARFDFDHLDGSGVYNADNAYKASKLANLWFAYELHRRVHSQGICVVAVCPGFVPETIADRRTGLSRFFFKHVMGRMPFANSAETATENFAFLAADPSVTAHAGEFWMDGHPGASSEESLDVEKARRLWTWTEKLVGLEPLPVQA